MSDDWNPDTFIAKSRMDHFLTEAITDWGILHYDELKKFQNQMRELRASRTHQDRGGSHAVGLSNERSMLHFGEMPRSLYAFIGNRCGNRNWTMDHEMIKRFWKLFKIGRINQTSEPVAWQEKI